MASWLAGIGIGGAAIGGLLGAQGAQLTGQAQSQAYLYQAGVAQINSQLAYRNANFALQAGNDQAMVSGMQGGQQLGQIKAAEGASNLDVNSGSAKQVQSSQDYVSRLNQMTIRSNAAQVAYGYKVQGATDTAQAAMDFQASNYAKEGADISAGASIIGGATSVASKWLQAGQTGALPNYGIGS